MKEEDINMKAQPSDETVVNDALEVLQRIRAVDKKRGYDRVVLPAKVQLRRKHLWQRIAASAAVIAGIFLGIGIWNDRNSLSEMPLAEKISDTIVPGQPRARLILADHREILLDTLSSEQISAVSGVMIYKKGQGISYETQQQPSEREGGYHELIIPRGGEYDIVLEDGTHVWLNADSKLRYPVAFSGKERRVYLEGEAYFDVTKNNSKPFIVETDLGNVKVYGTEFNVKRYQEDKQLKTTLIEGSIGFSSDKITERKLKPGYQLSLAEGAKNPEIKQVKVYNEVAWRNKQFNFENETLEEIARDLERWYDVRIIFDDPSLKDLVFSGTLNRYGKIDILLRFFEEGVDVKFLIEKDTIKVMRK